MEKNFVCLNFCRFCKLTLKPQKHIPYEKYKKKKILKYDAEKKQSSTRKYIDPRNLDRGYRGTTLFV